MLLLWVIKMIVFDGVVFSWYPSGGVAVYFKEIYSELVRKNIDSVFYNYCNETFDWPSTQLHPRFLERYRDFDKDVGDIFHSTYYRIPSSSNQAKIVTTVHDFTYERYVGGARQLVHSWQKFRAIRASDMVICVSQNTKKDLLEYLPDFPESRIAVIYNGVSDVFRPLNEQYVESSKYVLFVGARGGYKNFIMAVDAVSILNDINLVCVGGGGFSYSELRVLKKKLPNRFFHKGRVSTEELNSLYNGALCLLYPSLYEGFGIPLIESMRAGCPVIAANNSSIPEVVGDVGGLVNESHPEFFSREIELLLNEDVRFNRVEKGFEQAKKFSWESTANQTIDVYEKLIGGSLYIR